MSDYRTPSDIHPCLTYADANAAIEWLCRAFGFTKRLVVPGFLFDENGKMTNASFSRPPGATGGP